MKEKLTLFELKTQVAHYFNKHGKVPTAKDLQEILDDSTERIDRYLEFLREKEFIIKDATGMEIVNPEKYKVENIKPEEKLQEITDAHTFRYNEYLEQQEKEVKTPEPENTFKTNFRLIKGLRFVMLFIGIGATYLSIHFSYAYLETLLSPFRAFILALVMVVYGVASFELMALLWMRFKRILAGVFAVLWLVVTVFSMVSTVAGQYSGNMARVQADAESRSAVWEKTKEYEEHKQKRAELETHLSDLRAEDKRVEGMLAQYSTPEQIQEQRAVYNQLRYEKRQVSGNIQAVVKQIAELDRSRPEIVREEKQVDFYMWVAGVLGIAPDVFQFWLSLFPALFIDLAAPFSIAIFLFVKDQEV